MTPAQRGTYRRTRRAARLLSVAVAGLLLLTSCGLGKKQQVGNFDYSGTWRGTVTDEANGAGSLLVTLQQAEYALAGTCGFAEQVLIAVGEGAKALLSAYEYLLPRL